MTVEDAYADFHQRMAAVGQRITEADFPDDPRMRAEGYRYLTRLQGFAMQWYLEFDDPEHPAFFRFGDEIYKWGSLNADNQYLRARIESSGTYRIYGNIGGVSELLISLHDGEIIYGKTAVLQERCLADLKIDGDGSVELFLGGTERSDNWIPLDDSAELVVMRQYISDWEHDDVADLRIERLDDDGRHIPAPLTPDVVAVALDRAAAWVERSVTFWNEYTLGMQKALGDNVLTPPHRFEGGAVNMAAGVGWWKLAHDEALLIESDVPAAPYWSLQLTGPTWFEGPDFTNRVTSLNQTQTHIDDDGRMRMVLSHHDPRVHNWLDTTSFPTGMIGYRWVRPSTTPNPTATVVKFDQLRHHLPASTPTFSPDERVEQIRHRRAGIARRFRR
jgi:hypothetical protein